MCLKIKGYFQPDLERHSDKVVSLHPLLDRLMITKFSKTTNWRSVASWLPLLGLIVFYLSIRLIFLDRLPVFVDESVHLQWAKQTIQGDLMAGLWAGRWLPIKIMSIFLLLPYDSLISLRLSSVVMGLGSMIALVLINHELFSISEGIFAGLLYIVFPFALFYDRLGLADGFLTAFGAWIIFFSIKYTKRNRLITLLALTFCLCCAILSKFTGILFISIPFLAIFFFTWPKDWLRAMLRLIPILLPTLFLVFLLIWRGMGNQYVVTQTSNVLLFFRTFVQNIGVTGEWFWSLLTPIGMLLLSSTIVWVILRISNKGKKEIFLLVVFLTATLPYILVSRIWYPRYLMFAILPATLLISRFVVSLTDIRFGFKTENVTHSYKLLSALGLILIIWPFTFDLQLITNPEQMNLPLIIRAQYISGWSSGYGLKELAHFLKQQAEDDEINVLRYYFWAPPYQGLDVYLKPQDSIHVYTINPVNNNFFAQIKDISKTRRTLFVSNPDEEIQQSVLSGKKVNDLFENAKLVWQYYRPGSFTHFEVWEISSGK
jgi:hypothetical protein